MQSSDSPVAGKLHPSPNFEQRLNGKRPDMLLLHYTGMHSAEKAIDWLSRPESKVSCHYLVDEQGRVTQLVPEAMRAWHAGVSSWFGENDINSVSIGIEIHNPGHQLGYPDYSHAQMQAVADLSADIVKRNAIPAQRVLAHSDVAPTRKIDPGEKFDWGWLAQQGVGHWVAPEPVQPRDRGMGYGDAGPVVAEVQNMLRHYGYSVEVHSELDQRTGFAVRAFQLHFRPARVDSRIDQSTITTLERLLAALPQRVTS